MGWTVKTAAKSGWGSGKDKKGKPLRFVDMNDEWGTQLVMGSCFAPSTNIAHAFQVVEKIMGSHYDYQFELKQLTGRRAPGRFWAKFTRTIPRKDFEGFADNAPEAICRAALEIKK